MCIYQKGDIRDVSSAKILQLDWVLSDKFSMYIKRTKKD